MATVTAGKTFISGETVTPGKLNSLGLPTVALADDEVVTSKILNLNVTSDKLATGAVTGAAGGGKLAASAITAQTLLSDPIAAEDEFLMHDYSASSLKRAAWSSIQPSGSIVQTVSSSDALSGLQTVGVFNATGSPKFIPFDTSIPQNDEGIQVATVAITPKYSTSKIRLQVSIGAISASPAVVVIGALFKDSDANAFATAWRYVATTAAYHGEMSFMAEHSPSTTSSVTYKLRLGPDNVTNPTTVYVGGQSAGFTLGGTTKIVFTATEIRA